MRRAKGNAYLQEPVDEVARQPGLRILFCAEVLENVGELFPVIEGFLAHINSCPRIIPLCSASSSSPPKLDSNTPPRLGYICHTWNS